MFLSFAFLTSSFNLDVGFNVLVLTGVESANDGTFPTGY